MGKVKSTFEKGLSTDFSPLKQPKGTYRNAENIIRDVMGTVKSEPGTTLLAELDLTNTVVIGEIAIEEEIYYFTTSSVSSSIVKLDSNNTLTYLLTTGTTPGSSIPTDLLAFSTIAPIQAVARRTFKSNIILYWVDKFNIPRRFDTSETITEANFTAKLTLFTNPGLPRVTDLNVIEGGGLTTGLYKFAARLVTGTGNTTTFSQISHGIPIVNDVKSAGMIQYDGAPPQTPAGKSIKINLESIDTTYNFVEIVAITYLGLENLLSSFIVAKIPITTSTVEFEYSSVSQHLEEIILEELISEATGYVQAETIVQKDNHLFLANLEQEDLTFIDAAMETLVNNIEVHFKIKEAFTPNRFYTTSTSGGVGGGSWNNTANSAPIDGDVFAFTDLEIDPIIDTTFENYKEPDYTYNFKGYQRDEVYSFAIVPIFPGGIHGTAYHIPGDSTPGRISFKGEDASETGTRLRSWLNDDGTYHHRMPSIDRSPFVIGSGGIMYILGLEFKNIDLASAGLDTILEGYTIVRQRRNKPGNGIVTAQGIAKELFDDVGGGLTPTPFLGKCGVIYNLITDSAQVWGDKTIDSNVDFDLDRTGHFIFYSPDIIHDLIGPDYFSGMQEIKQVDIRSVTCFADNRGNKIANTADFTFGCAFRDVRSLKDEPAADTSNLNKYQVLTPASTKHVSSFIAENQISVTLDSGVNVKTAGMTDALIMKVLNEPLNKEKDFYTDVVPNGGLHRSVTISINLGSSRDTQYRVESFFEALDIYTVYSFLSNVYGSLDSAEYILVDEIYLDDAPGVDIEVFGGDVFLNSYMFLLGEKGISTASPRDFRANVQIVLETRGNYDYRHFEAKTFEGDIEIEGTMPYAPKYPLLYSLDTDVSRLLGIWNYNTAKGPGDSYNKHYNFENTLNKYYPKDQSFEAVSNFPDRIIYSLESFENEQFDAYRTFLINNFHDVPKETGEITNIFEYSNILYAHTPHSLWRTFVNEKTFTNTSSGDIVLGNGGLFPMPSEQVYTQAGGFAGSSAKFTSINTPYGRVFVDDHQRKVFMLVGKDQLNELSYPYMFNYFNDKINPIDATTYQAGYEPLNKRFILALGKGVIIDYEITSTSAFNPPGFDDTIVLLDSKYGNVTQYFPQNQIFLTLSGIRSKYTMTGDSFFTGTQTGFIVTASYSGSSQTGIATSNIPTIGTDDTISYSFELHSWSSLHTYTVAKFSNRDNLLYAAVGNKFHELGTGDPNNIFEIIRDSKLSIVVNDSTESKEFRNLKWIQRNKVNIFNNIVIRTENFTTGNIAPSLVTSFADEQNFLPLGQQQVHLVGGEHRMNIPPDNNPTAEYTDENFRPTIKGKYGIVDLTFIPTLDPLETFELEELETEYINIAE